MSSTAEKILNSIRAIPSLNLEVLCEIINISIMKSVHCLCHLNQSELIVFFNTGCIR